MSVVIKGDSNVNLDFSTGGRITGDFSNATIANRVMFQTSTTNGATGIIAIPNGTGVATAWRLYNSSDTANASVGDIAIGPAAFEVRSFNAGTGTNLPMTFSTGGSERVRIDTSGNVGIGTSSPATKFNVYTGSATNTLLRINNTAGTVDYGVLSTGEAYGGFATSTVYYGTSGASPAIFYTNNVERLRITSAGDVGIGTSSPSYKLEVASTNSVVASRGTGGYGSFYAVGSGTNSSYLFLGNAGGEKGRITSNDDGTLTFGNGTSSTERARITSGGDLLVGTTTAGARTVIARPDNDVVFRVYNSLTSGTTFDLSQVITAQTAGTGYNLLRLFTSNGGAAQFAVRADGVVFAQNTTIQSISDARVKENVRDADDGLETILGLRPVRFDFKEGFGNNRKNQLGFIAQEVEAVFSDAVDVAGEKDENGDPYKSVGPSALVPVLVKAIQEQQVIIESLTARITALEAK